MGEIGFINPKHPMASQFHGDWTSSPRVSFMRSRTLTSLLCIGLVGHLGIASLRAADAGANDNARPPYKVIYRWGQGGAVKGLYDAYGDWLNRKVLWAEDFMPKEGWNKIEGEQWQLGTWQGWVSKVPGRKLVLSVPLLPGGWDCSGPIQGPGKGEPVSLAKGAAGEYNEYFQKLAENLVLYGLGDSILRLGWEFNGGWYTWRADTEDKAKAFAGYFRQIVQTMRAVPGAENLKFVWNPAMEPWWPYSPETAWPGDDVVDIVGIDVYDQSWAKDTYPFPEGADEGEIAQRQEATWNRVTNNEKAMGLPYWAAFAKKHGKPMAIPEWGVCLRKDGHGGLDNPGYIEKMVQFINDPENNVYFECYFDVAAPDGDHQLCPDPNKDRPTKFPKASAKFLELYRLPGANSTPAASNP